MQICTVLRSAADLRCSNDGLFCKLYLWATLGALYAVSGVWTSTIAGSNLARVHFTHGGPHSPERSHVTSHKAQLCTNRTVAMNSCCSLREGCCLRSAQAYVCCRRRHLAPSSTETSYAGETAVCSVIEIAWNTPLARTPSVLTMGSSKPAI